MIRNLPQTFAERLTARIALGRIPFQTPAPEVP